MYYLQRLDISQVSFTWEIVYGGCGTVKSPESGELVLKPSEGTSLQNEEKLKCVLGLMKEGHTEANFLLDFWGIKLPTRRSNNYSGYDKLTVTIEGTSYNWVKKVTEKETITFETELFKY